MKMSNFDEIVGNVKKEVGDAIGSSKLQAEGLIQEGVGKAKEVAANLEKQAADALEKGKETAEHLATEAKEKAENLVNDIKSKF
ncbi:CsbD family protein [Kingella denitrificans]|uniref:CsbD family protein n=1 Tax=Kingella denitrificans TaxID=502 RepID=UPI00288A268A|nr:CsbD family protein [Kingella denitrificans]